MRRSICCQHPLKIGLGMQGCCEAKASTWIVNRCGFRSSNCCFQSLSVLFDLNPGSGKPSAIRHSYSSMARALTGGFGSTESFYRWSAEIKCDDNPEETLGLDSNQLAGLFQRTFGLAFMGSS